MPVDREWNNGIVEEIMLLVNYPEIKDESVMPVFCERHRFGLQPGVCGTSLPCLSSDFVFRKRNRPDYR